MTQELIKISSEDSSNKLVVRGDHYHAFRKRVLSDIPNYERIVEAAEETIRRFNEFAPGDNKNTGLGFGKVQSGKTTYFHTVTALAFDNDYDVVIILSGVNNDLLNQNEERIDESFLRAKDTGLYSTTHLDSREITRLKRDINSGVKVIVTALKHRAHIDKASELITKYFNCDTKILLIDDEGDQYTLNTKVNSKKGNDVSLTYQSVIDLQELSDNIHTLSVTATPQANLFIDIYDNLSPSFVVLLEAGDGYCGLETFHQDNTYIEEIEPLSDDDNTIEVKQLEESIDYYLFTMYECINNESYKDKKNYMLIHNSRLISDHQDTKEIVTNYLETTYEILYDEDYEGDVVRKEQYDKVFNSYKKFDISNMFDYDFDEYINNIELVLLKLKYDNEYFIKVINSSQDSFEQENLYGIVIGGDKLGRGITIKGLTTTYLQRDTKSASQIDTVLQRARWFGYREDYLPLIKIFTTETIANDFENIYYHNISLIQELEFIIRNGLNVKEHELYIEKDKSLKLTRQNVLKKGSVTNENIFGYFAQKNFSKDTSVEYHNKNTEFFSSIVESLEVDETKTKNNVDVVYKLPKEKLEEINNYINNNKLYDKHDERMPRFLEELSRLDEDLYLVDIRVNSTSAEYKYKFRKSRDGSNIYVGNVQSGRRTNVYSGDSKEYDNLNHIQFHRVVPYEIDKKSGLFYGETDILTFIAANISSINRKKTYSRRS